MPPFTAPKGTHDILPDQYYAREKIARTILSVLEKFGYTQVVTPVFENIEVMKAKAGEQILEQIYDFHDKGGRHLSLRSDITASIGRLTAALAPGLPKPIKISAFDRLWRYERPQSGRFREFWQINAELFGATGPMADAEIIAGFTECFLAIGLDDFKIHISHRRLLEDFVRAMGVAEENVLSVIRAVDKAPKLKPEAFEKEAKDAGLDPERLPDLAAFTSLRGPMAETLEKAREMYAGDERFTASLDDLSGMFAYLGAYGMADRAVLDLSIARGLDYYTGVIFECVYNSKLVGSIGGGGRYDDLIGVFGGPATPAIGFSVGFDRVMVLLNSFEDYAADSFRPRPDCYVAVIDASCAEAGVKVASALRRAGRIVEIDLLRRKVKAQFGQASKMGVPYVVVVGPDEVASGEVVVKDMAASQERRVSMSAVADAVPAARTA